MARLIGPKVEVPAISAGGAVEEPLPSISTWTLGYRLLEALGPQGHQVVHGVGADALDRTRYATGIGVYSRQVRVDLETVGRSSKHGAENDGRDGAGGGTDAHVHSIVG